MGAFASNSDKSGSSTPSLQSAAHVMMPLNTILQAVQSPSGPDSTFKPMLQMPTKSDVGSPHCCTSSAPLQHTLFKGNGCYLL
jgi:hypothetical protein